MSKAADPDFDHNVKRIIDEVQDFDLDDQDVNIEDLLRENDEEYVESLLNHSEDLTKSTELPSSIQKKNSTEPSEKCPHPSKNHRIP